MIFNVPFNTVARLDAELFANVRTVDEISRAMVEYKDLLEACGWTERDYENMMLARINGQWD